MTTVKKEAAGEEFDEVEADQLEEAASKDPDLREMAITNLMRFGMSREQATRMTGPDTAE